MKKLFSKFQIASFKRIAQNINPLVREQQKLAKKIAELQEKFESNQRQIDAYEAPVREATGGFTTDDIVVRDVIEGVDKNGKPIKTVAYRLRFPETIVPPVEEEVAANECLTFEETETPVEDVKLDVEEESQPIEIDPFDMRLS